MPHGMTARGSGQGLAASARAQQGIPQPMMSVASAPDEAQMADILQALRGGQIGAENFMQLLSLLMARTQGGGVRAAPQPQQRAPQPRQMPRRAAPGEQRGSQQPSIRGLLGGGR